MAGADLAVAALISAHPHPSVILLTELSKFAFLISRVLCTVNLRSLWGSWDSPECISDGKGGSTVMVWDGISGTVEQEHCGYWEA